MSSDRIVYGAYAIGTLCALGGAYLGWRGHANEKQIRAERAARRRTSTSSSSSSPKSPKHRVNKRKLRQFMKKMPSESQFVALMEATTRKFGQGGFYDDEVLQVRSLIMDVGRNEDLRPYSLDCTLDCLEWLSSYHSHLTSMTLQASGESPEKLKEAVVIMQEECRMELEPFWDIVNGRSAQSTSIKERLRVGNILVAMASSQKWFARLSQCYHMLRDLDVGDHEEEKQQGGYHMQQIINLFLTAPTLGEWADLAKFADLIEQMQKGGGFKKQVIESVFAHQGHLRLMMHVGNYLEELPQTPPNPSTLKEGFVPIINLRKKLMKGTSTDADLQAKFDEQLDKWVETDQDHKPQILLEGACAHLLGITQKSLLSGSYDKDAGKIFAVLEHASGARKEKMKASRVTDEPEKGDNFWRGTMTVAAHTPQHHNHFEFVLEFELGPETAELQG